MRITLNHLTFDGSAMGITSWSRTENYTFSRLQLLSCTISRFISTFHKAFDIPFGPTFKGLQLVSSSMLRARLRFMPALIFCRWADRSFGVIRAQRAFADAWSRAFISGEHLSLIRTIQSLHVCSQPER